MNIRVCVCLIVSDSVAPWTLAHHAPLSMGFSRQEYWGSGLPLPTPGDLPDPGIRPRDLTQGSDPGINPRSPLAPALAGRFFTTSATWEALNTRKQI